MYLHIKCCQAHLSEIYSDTYRKYVFSLLKFGMNIKASVPHLNPPNMEPFPQLQASDVPLSHRPTEDYTLLI